MLYYTVDSSVSNDDNSNETKIEKKNINSPYTACKGAADKITLIIYIGTYI